MAMTEETLVQEVTAEYLLNELQWNESFMGMHEKLGKEGDLGRNSEHEVVLTRYLGQKIIELNPGLPDVAYIEALRIITETPVSKNIVSVNKEKYLLPNSSPKCDTLQFKRLASFLQKPWLAA